MLQTYRVLVRRNDQDIDIGRIHGSNPIDAHTSAHIKYWVPPKIAAEHDWVGKPDAPCLIGEEQFRVELAS